MFEKHVINIKTYNMPMMGLSNPFVGMMPPAPNYAAMMGMSVFSCPQPTMMPMPTNIPMSMPAMPTIPTPTLPTNLNMTGTSMPSVPNYANMSGGGLMDSYMSGLKKLLSNMKYIPAPTLTFPTINFNNTTSSTSVDNTSYSYNSSSKIKPGLLKGNLQGKEGLITQLCQKYNVDVGVVLSIIGQESGFGTSNLAKHNNFMGYRAAGDLGKSSKGFGYFSTPEKGLEAAIKNLASYPKKYSNISKIDFNNMDAIGKIYCEGNSYSATVKNLYNSTVKKYLV